MDLETSSVFSPGNPITVLDTFPVKKNEWNMPHLKPVLIIRNDHYVNLFTYHQTLKKCYNYIEINRNV